MARNPNHSAYDAAWRRRHPELAAAEQVLRKERRERVRAHDRRNRMEDPGTPETRQKLRQHDGAIARMVMAGHLTIDQLGWASEIHGVAERIGADVAVGTVSLETRVDGGRRGDGSFFEKLGAVRAERAYGAWRSSLGADAAALLAIVVFDQPVRTVARLARLRDETLRRKLSAALDRWPDYYRDAREAIGPEELLAAQAAIL